MENFPLVNYILENFPVNINQIKGGVFVQIVENIKLLATKSNITIAEVERNCGLGQGTIGKWSKSSPVIDKLLAVATYFKVSVDSLVSDESFPSSILREDEQQLLVLYGKLSSDGKVVARHEIKKLLEEYGSEVSAESTHDNRVLETYHKLDQGRKTRVDALILSEYKRTNEGDGKEEYSSDII